jgi:hypothetical protein
LAFADLRRLATPAGAPPQRLPLLAVEHLGPQFRGCKPGEVAFSLMVPAAAWAAVRAGRPAASAHAPLFLDGNAFAFSLAEPAPPPPPAAAAPPSCPGGFRFWFKGMPAATTTLDMGVIAASLAPGTAVKEIIAMPVAPEVPLCDGLWLVIYDTPDSRTPPASLDRNRRAIVVGGRVVALRGGCDRLPPHGIKLCTRCYVGSHFRSQCPKDPRGAMALRQQLLHFVLLSAAQQLIEARAPSPAAPAPDAAVPMAAAASAEAAGAAAVAAGAAAMAAPRSAAPAAAGAADLPRTYAQSAAQGHAAAGTGVWQTVPTHAAWRSRAGQLPDLRRGRRQQAQAAQAAVRQRSRAREGPVHGGAAASRSERQPQAPSAAAPAAPPSPAGLRAAGGRFSPLAEEDGDNDDEAMDFEDQLSEAGGDGGALAPSPPGQQPQQQQQQQRERRRQQQQQQQPRAAMEGIEETASPTNKPAKRKARALKEVGKASRAAAATAAAEQASQADAARLAADKARERAEVEEQARRLAVRTAEGHRLEAAAAAAAANHGEDSWQHNLCQTRWEEYSRRCGQASLEWRTFAAANPDWKAWQRASVPDGYFAALLAGPGGASAAAPAGAAVPLSWEDRDADVQPAATVPAPLPPDAPNLGAPLSAAAAAADEHGSLSGAGGEPAATAPPPQSS